MEARPVIGMATETLEAVPGQLPRSWAMGQRYVRVLAEAGAVPWLIPLLRDDEETLRRIYNALDGVFLSGGVDVDPSHYAEPTDPRCGPTDPDRDWTELRLVRWALRDRKPVLGVCRGAQLLNVAAGGTLFQDMPSQYPGAIKHDYSPPEDSGTRASLVHGARVAPGSRLAHILGGERVEVNSMHHQGIKALAPGLVPTAFAPDGSVEGVEGCGDFFLVGVQWHPEELAATRPEMGNLFRAFVEAAWAFRRAGRAEPD